MKNKLQAHNLNLLEIIVQHLPLMAHVGYGMLGRGHVLRYLPVMLMKC